MIQQANSQYFVAKRSMKLAKSSSIMLQWSPLVKTFYLVKLKCHNSFTGNPRRAKRALGSGENSSCLFPIDSEMAGQIELKLGGMIEGMGENDLAKEFLGSVEVDRGQVSGPQVPLLGGGMTKRPQIGHDGTSGHEMANNKVGQHLQGDQSQVGGPPVPLLSHLNETKSPNWACRHCRTWNGKLWGRLRALGVCRTRCCCCRDACNRRATHLLNFTG